MSIPLGNLAAALNRPRVILVGVMLVELLFFFAVRWRRVSTADTPLEAAGEGLVIRGDGLGCYAWLRSLMIDGDWEFDNEFDEHNPLGDHIPEPTWRTASGRRVNLWSVGPA